MRLELLSHLWAIAIPLTLARACVEYFAIARYTSRLSLEKYSTSGEPTRSTWNQSALAERNSSGTVGGNRRAIPPTTECDILEHVEHQLRRIAYLSLRPAPSGWSHDAMQTCSVRSHNGYSSTEV